MTRRAKSTAASNAGSYATARRAEAHLDLTGDQADQDDSSSPAYVGPVPAGRVKPVTCRKCKGGGDYTYAAGGVGACAPCSGTGQVEGDRGRIAHMKARSALVASFHDLGVGNHKVLWAIGDLRENEPDRYEKALASHAAGRPDLVGALEAHYAQANPPAPNREVNTTWKKFDDLHDEAKHAVGFLDDPDAVTREWQFARVPIELAAERIMAADPELAVRYGTFEAYHTSFMAQGQMLERGDLAVPSIEAPAGTGEYLVDGRRRFHSHVARGSKYVPVLRSRPETRTPDVRQLFRRRPAVG